MTRLVPQLGDLTYRVRDALHTELRENPDTERARLLRDMLAFIGAPETLLNGEQNDQERLYRQIHAFPGRTMRWHAVRLGRTPERVRGLMYDLEAQNRVRRQSLTVLFCGPEVHE